jgi:hypothetical protein
MRKAVQKTKIPTFFRYEFSDETGRLEGGDIFEISSVAKVCKMMNEAIEVAENDGVTVSFTIGKGENFFKFLKNTGLNQKELDNEMVPLSLDAPADKKVTKKATKSKVAKKKSK